MTKKKQFVAKVVDKGAVDYFYMTPNLVDDTPMSLSAFRLYAHLKRVAGDAGKCWQSTETLAYHCNLAPNTIVKAKRELRKLGLIVVRKAKSYHGGHPWDEITIVNIWQKNHNRYYVDPSAPHEDTSGYRDDDVSW
jgi:hypothetical protein